MDIEDLRTEVEAISASVTKLRNGGITDDALEVLIQHASPSISTSGRRSQGKPTLTMIRAVMDGMESLEEYVFGGDDDEDSDDEG